MAGSDFLANLQAARQIQQGGQPSTGQNIMDQAGANLQAQWEAQSGPAQYTPEMQAATRTYIPGATEVGDFMFGDGIEGHESGGERLGRQVATGLNNFAESASLGVVGDEANAAFDAAVGRRDTSVTAPAYDQQLGFYRDQQEQFREEAPWTSFATEMAPALLPGIGGARLAQALAKTRLGRAGTGAVLGGAGAGLYGAAEGEGGAENRAYDGAISAGLGTLFGAAAPRVADALANAPARLRTLFQRSNERPTVQVLQATKNAAYDAVEAAGETFEGADMTALAQRVRGLFDADNYVEDVDGASRAVLRVLDNHQDTPVTLSQLDRIRQNMWSRYSSMEGRSQPRILDAIAAIDELVDMRAGASELMGIARAANARFAKSQLLENAFERATDQTAATGSGGNILNKYRQAVTSIINNPRQARFFSGEEVDMMRGFVRGDGGENVLRRLGKLSPGGNGLMLALHTYGAVATGGMTVPLMMAGAGAKSAADGMVQRGANRMQDVLAGHRSAPVPAQMTPQGSAAATAAGVGGAHAEEDIRYRANQIQSAFR